MKEKFCEDCIHFYQHYRKENDKYHKINCGHCVGARLKKCEPDRPICTYFVERKTK